MFRLPREEANAYIARNHRHNKPTNGHKWSVACYEGERLCGVAAAGQLVARKLDDGLTGEIRRVCTDGTPNACSILYGACARIARNMGYKRVITYTLLSEPGTSLKASGFRNCGEAGGVSWNMPGRPREVTQVTLFGEEQKYPEEKNTLGKVVQVSVGSKTGRNNMDDFQRKYLTEVGRRIQHEGFAVCEEKDGLIPVEWAGSHLCTVNGNGGVLYEPEQVRRNGLEDAFDLVRETVGNTLAYMRQMETAPRLLAEGLTGDYRILAEHNGTLLAGHQTQYGVEFVTWNRLQDGTLWQGHYFNTGEGNAAAKRDFTVRSGLLPANVLFTQEQLAVIYDAAQNMTTMDLVSNPEQDKLLEGIMEQIEEAVPQVIDLANELTQSPKQRLGEMQQY